MNSNYYFGLNRPGFIRKQLKTFLPSHAFGPILIFLAVMLAACNDSIGLGSKVGSQEEFAPIAVAAIVGAGADSKTSTVRSGADVLVTAKDSDGVDDPIMDYRFSVLSVTGDASVTLESLEANLFEKTANTKLFRSPSVNTETTVVFEVTVIDADGAEAKDTVELVILPLGDSNTFLAQAGVTDSQLNSYELVVALNLEAGEVTNSSFELVIFTIVEWMPTASHPDCVFGQNANLCRMTLSSETIQGDWESGLSRPLYSDDAIATPPPELVSKNVFSTNATFNPRYQIELPSINMDQINRNFEDSDREKRLTLSKVDTVRAYHQYQFVSSDNSAELVILDANGENSGITNHTYTQSSPSSVPSDLISIDEIRVKSLSESILSGLAYNYLIDPNGEAQTLDEWKVLRGFVPGVEAEPEFAHALYLNNYDLGFGRDMFMRTDECGNVFSYVENYPTLELAIKNQKNFATVVMEYSPLVLGSNGACSNDQKFVKFFAYVPDEATGQEVIMPTMNFDGRGEKSVPGVCTACHGGSPQGIAEFVRNTVDVNGYDEQAIFAAIDALSAADQLALADLDATFMPFDLDSFLFTLSANPQQQDPYYSPNEISGDQIVYYSRESQLDAFRTMNKASMRTYLDRQASLVDDDPFDDDDPKERWSAPIALVNSWYGTSISDLTELDELNFQNFNGDAVLDGWLGDDALYHDVFARNCRACHIQIANTTLNFDSVDEFTDFGGALDERLKNAVFEKGIMPLARLTMDRFWVDYNGEESAASILQNYLGVTTSPGAPIAEIVEPNAENDYTVGDEISFSANESTGQGLSYNWDVSDSCGDNPFVRGKGTSVITLQPQQSPCSFSVTLAVANHFGESEKFTSFNFSQVPTAVDFSNNLDGYTPGNNYLIIDIDSEISDRGDNASDVVLSLVIPDGSDDELELNTAVTNNFDGTVSYQVPVFDSLSSVPFEYKVIDFDGSISNVGTVAVSKPAILPENLSISNTVSSATLEFDVPSSLALNPNAYFVVEREGPALDGSYSQIGEFAIGAYVSGNRVTYSQSGLLSNSDYRYRVALKLGADSSAKATSSGISTDVSAPSFTFGSFTENQISLNISPASGSTPTSYRVRRYLGTTTSNLQSTISTSNTTYAFSGLSSNQAYTFTVETYENNAYSPASAASSIKTRPAAPQNFAHNSTTSNVSFTWTNNNNSASTTYSLMRREADTSNSFTVVSGSADISSGHSITPGILDEYDYRLRANGTDINSANVYAYSSTVSNVRELVSYSGDIAPIVTNKGCAGSSCHVNDAGVLSKLKPERPCLVNSDSTATDCYSTMSFTWSNTFERRIYEAWHDDGAPEGN